MCLCAVFCSFRNKEWVASTLVRKIQVWFRVSLRIVCVPTVWLQGAVPSSHLCWNSRWGRSCGHVGFRIPVTLHMPRLWKTRLLLTSAVFVSTNEEFCSWQRGNTSVTMEIFERLSLQCCSGQPYRNVEFKTREMQRRHSQKNRHKKLILQEAV